MVGAPVTATAGLQSFRIDALFAANERRLGQFLVAMVRDCALAEDLLQETFLDAYNARQRLPEVERPEAWLFGIARNRGLRALRRRRRLQRAVERLWQSRAEPQADAAQIEVMDVLDRVLSPDDRSLVLLRYVHDLDAPTLAELTGRSPAAIRKRLQRACAALRKEIEP